MLQCARTFQVNCCIKVHNAHLKLLSPISGISYTEANPRRAGEIWQYVHVINRAAAGFQWNNVSNYNLILGN